MHGCHLLAVWNDSSCELLVLVNSTQKPSHEVIIALQQLYYLLHYLHLKWEMCCLYKVELTQAKR